MSRLYLFSCNVSLPVWIYTYTWYHIGIRGLLNMINHSEHLDDVHWFLHYLYFERQYHKAVLFRLTEIGREEKSSILKEHFLF